MGFVRAFDDSDPLTWTERGHLPNWVQGGSHAKVKLINYASYNT